MPDINPGVRTFDSAVVCILKNHCVYSLAVLLWLLSEEKYSRPDYAETSDVSDVYGAIAQGRDSEYILTKLETGDVTSGGGIEALKIIKSTFNFQKEGLPTSWLKDFKEQVKTVFSSYETMDNETTV